MNTKIAIIEDHLIFAKGLFNLIVENGICNKSNIMYFKNSDEFYENLSAFIPNLLITDISLPGLSGIEICKNLKQTHPHIYILIISVHDKPSFVLASIRAKVDGYLVKDTNENEIIEAINSLLKGEKYFSKLATNILVENMITGDDSSIINSINLSSAEIEMIKLISMELTQDEISIKMNLSTTTLTFYRRNVMAKLKVRNTAGLIKKAFDLGIL